MKKLFLKQENMLMTWQRIYQWGILHAKHKVRVKWTLLIGVAVSNAGAVKIMTQKTRQYIK